MRLIALILSTIACFAQTGTSYTFLNPPPPQVTSLTGTVVGEPGQETYYYWVVARYPGGNSAPYGPVTVRNARTLAQMGTLRYVTLTWTAQGLATGYDVLRSTSATTPTGACSCVIFENTSSTTVNDTGITASAYTVMNGSSVYGAIYIDSLNEDPPKLKQNVNGTISDVGAGGGGATALSGLTDLQVSYSSSTVLNIATGKARQGATTTSYGAATATLSGTTATSTAYVYITSGGVLTVGHNGTATVTCSGCTTATGISAFPADALPIATATYTSTAWDVSGITDLRAIPSRENLAAGDGITLSFGASSVTAATDSATVPRYSTGSGVPSAACTQGRDFYLDTAASSLYQCTATNTWGAVGSGSSLPTQTGNGGKVLETDGSSASWQVYGRTAFANITGDICNASPQTVYDFPANFLAAGDMVDIQATFVKSGTVSTPTAIVSIEGTSASGSNAMGSTVTDGWAFNRVLARITSTTATEAVGMRQRSNGSVGGQRVAAITIDTTSATGFTVQAHATSCSGGDTVTAYVEVRVVKNASR